ncbi:hypothetical protein BDQ17DRAFT_349772 [Cyathus striatus]|nr:hypothetical protein BDQ17DRAFT_349772 [Cyathus striatus]
MDDSDGQWSIFIRTCSCLASLVVLICDYANTLQFEFRYVWKRPLNSVKFVYLFSRYFGLMSQMVNASLILTKLSQAPVELSMCRAWFIFLFVSCTIMAVMLDGIIMLRVYALHRKDRRVGLLLILIISTNFGLAIRSCVLTYGNDTHDDICNLKLPPRSMIQLGVVVIIGEVIVWCLTLAKRNVGAGHAKVVNKVVREGGWIFALMCIAAITTVLPYTSFLRIAKAGFVLVWPLTIFSVATCRLIKGLLELIIEPSICSGVSSSSRELTSFIDLNTFDDIYIGN